ncbi:MAG: cytochrome C oxidase subunit II [Gammaproteobacteria bacterium RIFCSPLOWO2_02_FULL_47_50]|jgi:cytochrome c oxidase subunit 2|nr:MAG: cytochrome C oxidase subunit II [Gammaproteobacteria bacterium RIFCSPLOWO2_01_FULL_47_190]OGT74594.1 MAG: cytochrome C oxidase subunit II [Gammaproteobacteria bacterium RIFCSPLOWO2_12_47_11]OGT78606.1 MAG: cytochrome C oxidase subunit II [Gammaproteobacteria bacterium RIFCSPLOWO2_02_FULL_47_50]OGT83631.1 MAG: cytochrome C oxidase subunit II [Gammaproteobacteria bacterium RIFCSPLOWO2_12_FULL_47_76]
MSISPPQEKLWWNEPIPKSELIWIIVGFIWGLIMFFMMIYWHAVGEQNLSNEAYRITAEDFAARTNTMIEKYKVRDEAGFPVVHPPPGSDVYLIARLWQWWPILELEKDQSYRLHISSMDWLHGFSLQPVNINLQIHPGYEMVLTAKPDKAGEYGIVCNEFCGIGHHTMVGRMYVIEK